MKLKLLILSKLMQRLLRILYKIIIPRPLQNAFTKHVCVCLCVCGCLLVIVHLAHNPDRLRSCQLGTLAFFSGPNICVWMKLQY